MNTMRYLCSLFGASTDDLVTAETPAGYISIRVCTYVDPEQIADGVDC